MGFYSFTKMSKATFIAVLSRYNFVQYLFKYIYMTTSEKKTFLL